ncbi:MAG: hypothetical protein JW751_21195 [Polyangiaceae bacterium]|nr:hypothetical protein [Polyangiaceae bacterium]
MAVTGSHAWQKTEGAVIATVGQLLVANAARGEEAPVPQDEPPSVVSIHAIDAATPPEALPEQPNPLALSNRMRRLHGMVEGGLGWLTLPGAEVCSVRTGETGCLRGDSSPTLEAWQLFRLPPALALGAGATMGLTPTTDTPERSIEGINREHSRRYLTVEGTGRAYPYVGRALEAWVGLTAGLVVVSDTFAVKADSGTDKPLIGSGGVVIRTEGFTSTLSGGVAYEFRRGWSVGGSLRVGAWFLPKEPKVSPTGDRASLAGQTSYFTTSVVLAYRVPL